MTGSLGHTVRLLRWGMLSTVVAVGVVAGALFRRGDVGVPSSLASLVAGALAATVALSLDDPAHALLAPLPVGPRRRALARVWPMGLAAAGGWFLFVASLGSDTSAFAGVGVRALVALIGLGVATAVVVQRRRPDVAAAAGAAVAFASAITPTILGRGLPANLETLWVRHPVPVLVGTCVVFVAAGRR